MYDRRSRPRHVPKTHRRKGGRRRRVPVVIAAPLRHQREDREAPDQRVRRGDSVHVRVHRVARLPRHHAADGSMRNYPDAGAEAGTRRRPRGSRRYR